MDSSHRWNLIKVCGPLKPPKFKVKMIFLWLLFTVTALKGQWSHPSFCFHLHVIRLFPMLLLYYVFVFQLHFAYFARKQRLQAEESEQTYRLLGFFCLHYRTYNLLLNMCQPQHNLCLFLLGSLAYNTPNCQQGTAIVHLFNWKMDRHCRRMWAVPRAPWILWCSGQFYHHNFIEGVTRIFVSIKWFYLFLPKSKRGVIVIVPTA